jgi:glycosyltransferase involved in cell wall biosynthesis
MRILAFADYYLPGFLAGGPIRALSNLVETFSGELEFDIVTREYDLGGTPYQGIERNAWHKVGPARVRYVGRRGLPVRELRRMLSGSEYQIVYLNSFFSPLSRAVFLARAAAGRQNIPLIVAPRGEFSPAALMLKPRRKAIYLWLVRKASALSDVVWQASSLHEAEDIGKVLGIHTDDGSVVVTGELIAQPKHLEGRERLPKRPGFANVVFLSRISRMKNLEAAIDVLSGVTGNVSFAVYGPIEDPDYWAECERAARALPQNVKMEYRGPVAHADVAKILLQNDLFFLPTRGENYGHVIVESLLAGCPVLISDRSHFRDLETKGAGWDLPLENPAPFRDAVARIVDMGELEHSAMRKRAAEYAESIAANTAVIEQNRQLFQRVATGASNRTKQSATGSEAR